MKTFKGQEWREQTHRQAEMFAKWERNKEANALYRQVIADAIAESKATRGTRP